MNVLHIAGKELRSYYASPMAYFITTGFLFISGLFFAFSVAFTQEASLRLVLDNLRVILLFIVPFLTMRLLSEEQQTGTIELLLTSPIRDWELVLGKFLGALGLYTSMIALTLYYPFLLNVFGKPDFGPIISGYVGLLLLGTAFIGIGLFTSAMTKNQIIAGTLAFAILLALWLAGPIADIVKGDVGTVLKYASILDHYNDFSRGVIDTRDVFFYLSVSAVMLFATVRVVEARRWL